MAGKLENGFRLFVPILAGATLRDRLAACVAALIGIAATGLACRVLAGGWQGLPILVAPMGASAVLLFAVPASPLAQPWPIFGGNVVSCVVGVAAARLIGDPMLAGGVAVGGAILAMSLLRCLHPPGGAAALTAVIGGPVVLSAGWLLPFVPVALNSAVLILTGWLFHRVSGHSYPHRPRAPDQPARPAPEVPGLQHEDIDRALADLGEAFDVSRADLDVLLQGAERHAELRRSASGGAR